MSCCYEGCRRSVVGLRLCRTHLTALSEDIDEVVEADYRMARGVYIGRTCFPERRLLEHTVEKGLTVLRVLYWCDLPQEAKDLESALLERFEGMRKVLNKSTLSDGRMKTNTLNAVYAAWTPKNGATKPKGRKVMSIDLFDVVHGKQGFPSALEQVLFTNRTKEGAEAALAAFAATQVHERSQRGR